MSEYKSQEDKIYIFYNDENLFMKIVRENSK